MASLVVILFITVMLLVILRSLSSSPNSATSLFRTYDDGYADGFKAARAFALQAAPQAAAQPSLLQGVITHVDAGVLTVRSEGFLQNARIDGVPAERLVTVPPNTTITLYTRVSDDVFAKQLATHLNTQQNRDSSAAPLPPPSPYTTSRIQRTDLVVGDRVVIRSAEGVDAATAQTVDAAEMSVFR